MKRLTPTVTTFTAVAVLLLWAASWVMSYVELGAWSLFIAFGIAAAKAVLVVLVFMELILERVSVHATLATGLLMVTVLLVFMLADVRTRETPPLLPAVMTVGQRESAQRTYRQ